MSNYFNHGWTWRDNGRNQTSRRFNAEMQMTPRTAENIKLCETLRSPRLCVEIFAQENFWAVWWIDVAQIGNLPYRGLAIRRASETSNHRRPPVGDTADWQSALLELRLPAPSAKVRARFP
jgi:hypothetical protein